MPLFISLQKEQQENLRKNTSCAHERVWKTCHFQRLFRASVSHIGKKSSIRYLCLKSKMMVDGCRTVTACSEKPWASDCLLHFTSLLQCALSYLCARSYSALPALAGAWLPCVAQDAKMQLPADWWMFVPAAWGHVYTENILAVFHSCLSDGTRRYTRYCAPLMPKRKWRAGSSHCTFTTETMCWGRNRAAESHVIYKYKCRG